MCVHGGCALHIMGVLCPAKNGVLYCPANEYISRTDVCYLIAVDTPYLYTPYGWTKHIHYTYHSRQNRMSSTQKCDGHMEVLAYNLLLEADNQLEGKGTPWRRKLDEHCNRVLHGKTLLPMFNC